MKKLLLVFFFLILFLNSEAQYHPFPMNDGYWIYQYYDDFHNPTSAFTTYRLNGDTIINSLSYKKIFASYYSGAIRESNKIIYIVPDTSVNEYILYNFNLNMGDTIIHPFGGAVCSNDTVTVTGISSVSCSDGNHREIWFSSFVHWIEGIGSTSYLLQPLNVLCVSGNDVLYCMTSDTTFTYPQGWSSCFSFVAEESNSFNGISISPNPAHDLVTINTGGLLRLFLPRNGVIASEAKQSPHLIIYNVLGENIYSAQLKIQNPQPKTTIDVSFLKPGIYFVEVNTGEKASRTKFIKE